MEVFMKSLFGCLLLLVTAVPVVDGFATSLTSSFLVSATVLSTCNFTTQDFTPINFGNISPPTLDATTAIQTTAILTCNNGTTGTIAMASTNGGTASQPNGVLKGSTTPANTLTYQLTTATDKAQSWFATTSYTQPFTTSPFTIYAYGWLSAVPLSTKSDVYTDTVNVTVTY
jgi:spore coat protein U-like protein